MFIVKITENSTIYTTKKLHLRLLSFLFSFSFSFLLIIFVSLIISVHSLTSESTNFCLHLQFLQSKYSPISQDLSHSHLQLLGFQKNP